VNIRGNVPAISKVRLAIVPLTTLGNPLPCSDSCPSLNKVTDKFFEKAFADNSKGLEVVPLTTSRHFFQENPDILRSLLSIKNSDAIPKNNPTLQEILGSNKMATLKGEWEQQIYFWYQPILILCLNYVG
jgi:hypothetical protein